MWQERAQQGEEVPGRGSSTQKVGGVEGEFVPQGPGRRGWVDLERPGKFLSSSLFCFLHQCELKPLESQGEGGFWRVERMGGSVK